MVLCVLLGLSACAAPPSLTDDHWTDRLTPRKGDHTGSITQDKGGIAIQRKDQDRFIGVVQEGTDVLYSDEDPVAGLGVDGDIKDVTVNLLRVAVEPAAKAILGDILAVNYAVDARVQAEVTIQTPVPISRRELVSAFQSILKSNGAGIVERNGFYNIVPSAETARTGRKVRVASAQPDELGMRSQVLFIRHVSAEEIRKVLEPMVADGAVTRVDAARNAIVVSGSADEIAAMQETIAVFDVDWMSGMSFALQPVKSSSPSAISQELETIFATKEGPLKGVVRFVPNERLNAILVISSRSKYLRDAASWIQRLDKRAGTNEAQLHVYDVQNRSASELAKVLQSVFRTRSGKRVSIEASVAPKLEPALVNNENGDNTVEETQAPDVEVTQEIDESGRDYAGTPDEVRVVADDANNSLLIVATDVEYERIVEVLQQVDSMPNQVMLEATIAEVTLTDELKFGMRWFFGEARKRGTFTDTATGAVVSSFPGFSYFFSVDSDIRVVINALAGVTKVQVLSSPTLMVLDNRTATLQVGDQVPIVTRQAASVEDSDAPIVNSIELKDTGVILMVTPRVNDSGRVILDVKQEVSDVVPTTTSGIDSPTIRQRKVATTVVVNDGDTLALGGLIQDRNTRRKTKVPLLGDIPLLGTAFRAKEDRAERTELVIFIRPLVVRDVSEARRITREFRRQLTMDQPRPKTRNKIEEDLYRIVE